jgi:septum site-determining protein MinC
MATRIARPRPERTVANLETNLHGGEGAILVRRTLRSGYSLQHPGHVVVIGDVNPGAEILSGGSVVVWGRLRGSVQAGVDGEDTVFVCALDLSPTQLRIADHDATPPQKRGKPQPEMVQIKDGRVVFTPWSVK